MVNARLRKSRPFFRILVATTIGLVLGASALVWTRTQIMSLRYQYSHLIRLETDLRHEVEKLRIEQAALSSPSRIENQARALGLSYPQPGQMVAVSASNGPAGERE